MSLDKPNPGQLKALWILMTAQSWGGALGAIAEGEPEVVKLIGDHDREVAKRAKVEALRAVNAAFISKFCNDHNEKIRWLRCVALNEEHLLELILQFFDAILRGE